MAVLPATASMTLAGVISGLVEAHVTVRVRLGKRGLAIILARRGVIILYHYDEFSNWYFWKYLTRISFSCVS